MVARTNRRMIDDKMDVLCEQTKANAEAIIQLQATAKELTEATTKLVIQLTPENLFQGFIGQLKQYVGGAVLGLFGSIGLVLLFVGGALMWVANKMGFFH